ncbi:hypothetical protein GGI13_006171 [Coemansia sp. RSA 455]|nr:hypothetical protein GGI13_006171 [Coemansia sp. RSA 455]
MNSDAEYAGGTLVEASDTYVGKMFCDDVAGVCAVAEDDTGLADEVAAGCVAVAVGFGKDADDVGGVDECAQDDDVEGVDECGQDDDDDKLVGNSVVGNSVVGNSATDDGCSTEVLECVAADDCSEDDSVSGSEDVKVGEADTCGDVGDDESAGDMDGPVSVEYAEVEDGSTSVSASADDVADDVANDVADGSADCEDVKYDDNSKEVGDGASSDGSGSANVEVAATTGVDVVEPCLLPYFVLTEEGKSDGDGGNDGVGDGGGDGVDVIAEGRAVAVPVPVL